MHKIIFMTLGQEIKKIREQKKLTIKNLSAITNIQAHRIKCFEENNININLKTYESLAIALGKKITLQNNE